MALKKVGNFFKTLFGLTHSSNDNHVIKPCNNSYVTKSYNNSYVTKSYNNDRVINSQNINYTAKYLADHRAFILSTWGRLSETVVLNWIILIIILISLLLLCCIIQSQWFQCYWLAKKKFLRCKNPIEDPHLNKNPIEDPHLNKNPIEDQYLNKNPTEDRNFKINEYNIEKIKSAALSSFIIRF
jgi:hypothetical protein